MQTAAVFNFRRPRASDGAHHRTQPGKGPQFASGDRVTWRNPGTGETHGGLVVEFVYPTLGMLLLRGDFGRVSLRTGRPHIQTERVRMEQVTRDDAPAGPEAA